MLRIIVTGLGFLSLLAGIVIVAGLTPVPRFFSIQLLIFGVLLLLGILFERRYRGAKASAAPLQQTGERFVDPTTGKLTEVLYDPETGERVYREIPQSS